MVPGDAGLRPGQEEAAREEGDGPRRGGVVGQERGGLEGVR